MKSNLPDAAYAHICSKTGKRLFAHHLDSVERGSQHRSIDVKKLAQALHDVRTSKLSMSQKKKAFNHLKNHAKQILAGKMPSELKCEDEDKYSGEVEEIEFLLDDVADNGLEAEIQMIRTELTPIMRVGTWNGKEFTLERLERLEKHFHKFKNSFLPAVKDGHDSFFSSDDDGEEPLGYIYDVQLRGKVLMAGFEYKPSTFSEKIENKSLRFKSSEIWNKWFSNGKEYEDVLTGVALLGKNPPAVANLGPIPTKPIVFAKDGAECMWITFDSETGDYTREEEEMGKKNTDNFDADERLRLQQEAIDEAAKAEQEAEAEAEAAEASNEQAAEESNAEGEAEESQPEEAASEEAPAEEEAPAVSVEQFSNMQSTIEELSKKLVNAEQMLVQFAKQKVELQAENTVDLLVRDGCIKPADKDIVGAIYKALRGTAEKYSADGSDKPVHEAFEDFLRGYKAWTKEEFAKIQKDAGATETDDARAESLPIKGEEKTEFALGSQGTMRPVKNQDLVKAAEAYQAKLQKEGKVIDFGDALIEVSRKRQ